MGNEGLDLWLCLALPSLVLSGSNTLALNVGLGTDLWLCHAQPSLVFLSGPKTLALKVGLGTGEPD